MSKIEEDVKLDFDDVLIKPKRSISPSRSKVKIHREFHFKYSNNVIEVCPVIISNMDTTGSFAMANSLMQHSKSLVALHKFYNIEDYKKNYANWMFYTMGIQDDQFGKLDKVSQELGFVPHMICIDVANGYTQYFVDCVKKIRDFAPDSVIMAGNVATPEMTQELIINGKADIVKVGIGPGSVCTTRLKTGVGVPQFSAVLECADVAHGLQAHICSDGGCKNPGDVAKAFGAGADFVMIGGMLAGTDECEGKWNFTKHQERVVVEHKKEILSDVQYKMKNNGGFLTPSNSINLVVKEDKMNKVFEIEYDITEWERVKESLRFHGMSSKEAMEEHNGGMASYKAAEGVEIVVPYKGKAEEIMNDILGGVRSACSMVGAETIKGLPKCCTFIKVNRTKEYLFNDPKCRLS